MVMHSIAVLDRLSSIKTTEKTSLIDVELVGIGNRYEKPVVCLVTFSSVVLFSFSLMRFLLCLYSSTIIVNIIVLKCKHRNTM